MGAGGGGGEACLAGGGTEERELRERLVRFLWGNGGGEGLGKRGEEGGLDTRERLSVAVGADGDAAASAYDLGGD